MPTDKQRYYKQDDIELYCGDCLDVMPQLDEQFDTIITDPPYGLEFMGKEWDKLTRNSMNPQSTADQEYNRIHSKKETRWLRDRPDIGGSLKYSSQMQEWHYDWAKAALEVAKPGAMLLAFGGTRTHHRLMCAIEDAGWEIRDVVMWVYASGFPKSHNISKAIDRSANAEREIIGRYQPPGMDKPWNLSKAKDERTVEVFASSRNNLDVTAPATEAAKLWNDWGTALKPAWEPIILAMKPRDGTFANNALVHGVAGLAIDACRVPTNGEGVQCQSGHGGQPFGKHEHPFTPREYTKLGRWPANLIHDGSDEVVGLFPDTGKSSGGRIWNAGGNAVQNVPTGNFMSGDPGYGDNGSAARFFYCAKASRSERGEGNTHPTVKPLALMRYLCRLTKTPTGGSVLDMFAGSGTTLIAAVQEGRRAVGIEIDEGNCQIAVERFRRLQLEQTRMALTYANR